MTSPARAPDGAPGASVSRDMEASPVSPVSRGAASPARPRVAPPAAAETAGCPVCGGPVPDRTGLPGRRAAWCSKGCRQAAWRSRRAAAQAAEAARQVAEQVPAARRDLANIGGALQAALDRMPDAAGPAAVCPGASGGRDADTAVAAPVSGWESDVAGWARRLAAAATRLAELADAHTSHVADHRRAAAVIRRPPASRGRDDESPAAPPAGIVATTAAEASATNHPAPAASAIDTDDLFDAVEDVLDVRDAPGIPRDVLQDAADVPAGLVGRSFADALDALAAVHRAVSGDGPVDDLAAAAAAVVRARPPYLPARADAAVTRLQEVVAGT